MPKRIFSVVIDVNVDDSLDAFRDTPDVKFTLVIIEIFRNAEKINLPCCSVMNTLKKMQYHDVVVLDLRKQRHLQLKTRSS